MPENPRLFAAVLVMFCLTVGCGSTSTRTHQPVHDTGEMFARMDRLTAQIFRGTSNMSEPHYQGQRPKLRAQLVRLGLAEEQADQVLGRVDDARADRAQVSRWWAGVRGVSPSSTAATASPQPAAGPKSTANKAD